MEIRWRLKPRLRALLAYRRKGRLRGLQRADMRISLCSLRRQALRMRASASLWRGFSRQPIYPLMLSLPTGYSVTFEGLGPGRWMWRWRPLLRMA